MLCAGKNVTKRVLELYVEGYKEKGRPKKRCMDCVIETMAKKESGLMRRVEKNTYCADLI